MKHRIYREQQLNCSLQEAWKFFSSANNLSKITPKEMNFVVITELADDNIYKGMMIDYFVSPFWGIKMPWKTEITEVDSGKSFTDFQKYGPYRLWNHKHDFIENRDGVLMKDTIDYELPFGIFGELAHTLFVRKKLIHIFNYRQMILEKMFNSKKNKI